MGHGLVALVPAHRNRPEILGAHHRAQAVATVEMAQVVGDASIPHQVFARDADLQDADFVVTQFGPDIGLDFGGMPSPQVFRRAQFGLSVLNPQIDWFLALCR